MGSRIFLATSAFVALAAVTACSGAHKQPTGPAPEYEDPPPPSWLKDGGSPAAPAVVPVDPVPTPPAATPVPVGGGNS